MNEGLSRVGVLDVLARHVESERDPVRGAPVDGQRGTTRRDLVAVDQARKRIADEVDQILVVVREYRERGVDPCRRELVLDAEVAADGGLRVQVRIADDRVGQRVEAR